MIKAVIFDMDGVLSDTQKVHAKVESIVLKEIGIELDPTEITRKFAGVNDIEMFKSILKENGFSKKLVKRLLRRKREMLLMELKRGADLIPGVIKVLKFLRKRRIPIGVASSSERKIIEIVLCSTGVKKFVDVVVGGDEVEKGKPDPEIFIKACEKLNVEPSSCVVIEDGKAGIIAAKRARMLVIGFGSYARGIADYFCSNMDDVLKVLKTLLREKNI